LAVVQIIFAIIQPPKLQSVLQALERANITRVTVTDSQGYGRQRGQPELYRGHEYKTKLLRKITLEIVVNDDFLNVAIDTIRAAALTGPEGSFGDGKIFVMPCLETIQIESGTRGEQAV
jgi:nitrogen regulatory protein P-II 1